MKRARYKQNSRSGVERWNDGCLCCPKMARVLARIHTHLHLQRIKKELRLHNEAMEKKKERELGG